MWWKLDFLAHMLPAVPGVHWGRLSSVTDLSKPWNTNHRRKYHLLPPAACETSSWLESRPGDSLLNPLEWEHSCFSIYWGINHWQMNVFWSLSKETLHYYTLFGLLVFDRKRKVSVTDEHHQTDQWEPTLFSSWINQLKRNNGGSVTLHVYLGRYLRSFGHKSTFRWTHGHKPKKL